MKFYRYFLLILIVAACQPPKAQLIKNYGDALGTTYSIQYEHHQDLQDEIQLIFKAVNQSMSTYLPESDISKINRGDTSVVVDSLFVEVYQASQEIWEQTDGLFDPTVGPLVNAYGFGPGKKINHITDEQIDSLMEFVGWDKVRLTLQNTIEKADPRVFIDFNAIAKGYTIDLIGRLFEQKQIPNYLIELGGELLAKGENPEKKESWKVGIDNPQVTEGREIYKIVALKDLAMASSGNYRKYFVDSITDEKYVHSINPKTGRPQKSNVLSVSVFAETCMKADAYATACMVMDFETSKAVLKQQNLEAFIIYLDDNQQIKEFATQGFLEMEVEE